MTATPPDHPSELPLPSAEEIAALRVDDFVLVSQWAPDTSGPEDQIWLRVRELEPGEPFDDGQGGTITPLTIKGTVCCWPLPDAVQQDEERVVFNTDVLGIVRKEDLPDLRIDAFLSRPGPEHDEAFKREFRRLRGEEVEEPPEVTAGEGAEPPEAQITRLAEFIMTEVPGEPSVNQGAVDCAIRIMRTLMAMDTFAVALQAVQHLFAEERRLSGYVPPDPQQAQEEGIYGDVNQRRPREDVIQSIRNRHVEGQLRLEVLRTVTHGVPDTIEEARRRYEFVSGGGGITKGELLRRGWAPDARVVSFDHPAVAALVTISEVALEDIEKAFTLCLGVLPVDATVERVALSRARGYIAAAQEEVRRRIALAAEPPPEGTPLYQLRGDDLSGLQVLLTDIGENVDDPALTERIDAACTVLRESRWERDGKPDWADTVNAVGKAPAREGGGNGDE